MTSIDFHVNLAEKYHYATRLVRKAQAEDAQLVVLCPLSESLAFSSALWSVSTVDFVAHASASSIAAVRRRSRVAIAHQLQDSGVDDAQAIVVNLCAQLPAGFERFGRLIELVGDDGADKAAGRLRWKHYQSRGYDIKTHDLAKSGVLAKSAPSTSAADA